ETVWPLDLGGGVAIPDAARPGPHPLSRLRRLLLVALGRRSEIALTLWQAPDLEIPSHDVRLLQHAQRRFGLAGGPPRTRDAHAARLQGAGRAPPWSRPQDPTATRRADGRGICATRDIVDLRARRRRGGLRGPRTRYPVGPRPAHLPAAERG